MSKPNHEEQQWRDIEHLLNCTFGDNHISSDPRMIRVTYDTNNKTKQELFHLLVNTLDASIIDDSVYKTQNTTNGLWIPEADEKFTINLRIPKDQNAVALLGELKSQFANQRGDVQADRVELRPSDTMFMHNMELLTGQSWREVIGGKYEEPVLEPILQNRPSEQQRQDQEMLLAEALIAQRPKVKAKNWLGHQQAIEEEKGSKPRTALPMHLVNSANKRVADKLSSSAYAPHIREEIYQAFSDGYAR